MNKLVRFLKEKVLVTVIQFTIGLMLPWWVIDLINCKLIECYESIFHNYNKFMRYSFGLILPWWTMFLFKEMWNPGA